MERFELAIETVPEPEMVIDVNVAVLTLSVPVVVTLKVAVPVCAECRAQFSVQGSSPFAKVAGKHLE